MAKTSTVFITGTTSGIGRGLVHALAADGYRVILHGRSEERVAEVAEEVRESVPAAKLETVAADLGATSNVRQLADDVAARCDALDVLINNAGLGQGKDPADRQESADGYELRFAVNVLAPFMLNGLLLEKVVAARGRIVNLASEAQQALDFDDLMLTREYDGSRAYSQSKLADIMITFELADRVRDQPITVNCVHPGSLLDTKMVREEWGSPRGSAREGVTAVRHVATAAELGNTSGVYFNQTQPTAPHAQAEDPEARQRLWEICESLTGVRYP